MQYIIVKEGDSFEKLTAELEMMRWELPKYNDLTDGSGIKAGDILYIQPKRKRAARENTTYVVKKGDTMYNISQHFGVKLSSLYKFNCFVSTEEPQEGDTIQLRKGMKCQQVY